MPLQTKTLRDQLARAEKSAHATERKLKGEAASVREDATRQLDDKEARCTERLATLKAELEERARSDAAQRDASDRAIAAALGEELKSAEVEHARSASERLEELRKSCTLVKELKRQHQDELKQCSETAAQEQEQHAATKNELAVLRQQTDESASSLQQERATLQEQLRKREEELAAVAKQLEDERERAKRTESEHMQQVGARLASECTLASPLAARTLTRAP